MLQAELQTLASDALEDAMNLAQTKALNSYSWSDCLNYLNYAWSDIYNRILMIDAGYYSTTVRLNTTVTTLPPFAKNSLKVYAAKDPLGFNRDVYRRSGDNDLRSAKTYHISGNELYCPSVQSRSVWLEYAPSPAMLFFTRNNRDPKIIEYDYDNEKAPELQPVVNTDYHMHKLEVTEVDKGQKRYVLRSLMPPGTEYADLGAMIDKSDEHYEIEYVSCDYPYVFVTYKHKYKDDFYLSGFYKDIFKSVEFTEYNPFEYTGRASNVRYLKTAWNDKTGMGVTVMDYNDYDLRHAENNEGVKMYRIKELGYTPDSTIVYPCPEAYRYLVARLADKFAALNESSVMGVAKELVEAKYAFEAFCEKDKSAWKRIVNVNGPYMSDWL